MPQIHMLDRMFQNTSKGQFQPPVVAIKLEPWPLAMHPSSGKFVHCAALKWTNPVYRPIHYLTRDHVFHMQLHILLSLLCGFLKIIIPTKNTIITFSRGQAKCTNVCAYMYSTGQ